MTERAVPSQSTRQIPLVDLRRVAKHGPCSRPHPMTYRPTGKPCSPTSMWDDIHFAGCPQAQFSRSGISLEWR